MNKNIRDFLPFLLLFVIINIVVIAGGAQIQVMGFDKQLLLGGNIFLFVLVLISFLLLRKAIQGSPQVFVRYFYISFLVKFLLVAIVALVYAKTGTSINRASIIACMALYIAYTFIEMRLLLKAGKK